MRSVNKLTPIGRKESSDEEEQKEKEKKKTIKKGAVQRPPPSLLSTARFFTRGPCSASTASGLFSESPFLKVATISN